MITTEDIERAHKKKEESVVKKEEDMMQPHELFELKVKQWVEGNCLCTDSDKGNIIVQLLMQIKSLYNRIGELEKSK